jgi:protoporphyrin/coproporphyrin ferrochelatase
MSKQPLGVLLMAYGTPRDLDEVEAYYTHIRRGNVPSPELLAQLKGRYEAIGGVSPLNDITRREAAGLEQVLNADGGREVKVYLGMKHAAPFIADTVLQMKKDGIEEAVALVLAPHYSTMSVQVYLDTALEASAACRGPRFSTVKSWHLEPALIDLLANRVHDARLCLTAPDQAMVLFSAHSLPKRILDHGDPYPDQLRETGEAIAIQLDLKHYGFAWQSAGRTPEPWLGPDILDVLRDLASQSVKYIVLCPAGFVSDHLEVLYDVDIECQNFVRELGIELVRTRMPNDDPAFLRLLAQVVRNHEFQAEAK